METSNMHIGKDTTRYDNRKLYLQHFEVEICSMAELLPSEDNKIMFKNIDCSLVNSPVRTHAPPEEATTAV